MKNKNIIYFSFLVLLFIMSQCNKKQSYTKNEQPIELDKRKKKETLILIEGGTFKMDYIDSFPRRSPMYYYDSNFGVNNRSWF